MSSVAVWEPASGREANAYRLNRIRDHPNAYCRPGRSSTGKTRNQPSTRGSELLCRRRPLVPVGSTPHGASTSGLSNTCSTCGLQDLEDPWNPNLGAGFPLRCFQRLSLPNVANRAAGATTGIPEVRPPRSSRTMGRPPQDSNERRG